MEVNCEIMNNESNYQKVSDRLKYDQNRCIGYGRFGMVFRGLFEENKPVAVKRFQRAQLEDEMEVKKEAQLLLRANDHPNILRYFCTEINVDFMFIATELCAGTLSDLVDGTYTRTPFENEKKILRQVTKGLAYLHSLGIVHRDLKPSNILIFVPEHGNCKPKMKLADFGLCKVLNQQNLYFNNTSTTNPSGTQGWIAPELYHNTNFDFKVDIFPLGCIFSYTITGGKHPFGDDVDKRFILIKEKRPMKLVRGDLKESYSNDGGIAFALIKRLLENDPSRRPIAQEILDDNFFKLQFVNGTDFLEQFENFLQLQFVSRIDFLEQLSILPDTTIITESSLIINNDTIWKKFVFYCMQRKLELCVIGMCLLELNKKYEEDRSIPALLMKLGRNISVKWSGIFGSN